MYIKIDRNNNITLTKQVYSSMKKLILSCELRPEEKLPSTRQ